MGRRIAPGNDLRHRREFEPRTNHGLMPWFYRAIETVQGRWECRHGAWVFDDHATLEEALGHLRRLAADESSGVQVFVHTTDGQVRSESIG
jgi:hypothetical protein